MCNFGSCEANVEKATKNFATFIFSDVLCLTFPRPSLNMGFIPSPLVYCPYSYTFRLIIQNKAVRVKVS